MADGLEFFLGLEEAVWQALTHGDVDADRSMLSTDFLGVYPSGFSDREEHASQLVDGPTVADHELSNARLMEITPEHVLLSYQARWQREAGGRYEVMYISSLWSRRDGEWINVFSQDTPATP